jgi:hypothetical protein
MADDTHADDTGRSEHERESGREMERDREREKERETEDTVDTLVLTQHLLTPFPFSATGTIEGSVWHADPKVARCVPVFGRRF